MIFFSFSWIFHILFIRNTKEEENDEQRRILWFSIQILKKNTTQRIQHPPGSQRRQSGEHNVRNQSSQGCGQRIREA